MKNEWIEQQQTSRQTLSPPGVLSVLSGCNEPLETQGARPKTWHPSGCISSLLCRKLRWRAPPSSTQPAEGQSACAAKLPASAHSHRPSTAIACSSCWPRGAGRHCTSLPFMGPANICSRVDCPLQPPSADVDFLSLSLQYRCPSPSRSVFDEHSSLPTGPPARGNTFVQGRSLPPPTPPGPLPRPAVLVVQGIPSLAWVGF